jgi:hypothetical protein
VACLQEALRLRPDFAEALNHLGLVYLSRSRPSEAAATARLFRLARFGDWDAVFVRMAQALARLRGNDGGAVPLALGN